MSIYWKYLWTVLKHKWFVLTCVKRTGISFLPRLLLHDLSKFLPSEFFPYARYWAKNPKERTERDVQEFEKAWALHCRRNKHHWQHWLMEPGQGDDRLICSPMDDDSLFELVCDWRAAGLAYNGIDDSKEYYVREGYRMCFHPQTRYLLELYLDTSWRPVRGDFKFRELWELRERYDRQSTDNRENR